MITIYDEYDANMQNNLTVNTSLEEAGEEGREEGRSYSNVCAEVDDDLRERVREGEEGEQLHSEGHDTRRGFHFTLTHPQPNGLIII